MRKAQLIKKVLNERPEFLNVDTFFFVKPLEHILSGFCCEVTPRGAYIWKFAYPLFDKFDCISLLYSQRLEYPEGYIDFEKVDKKELADEFLSRIDKYVENAYQYLTLDQFCLLYEERPDLLKHERAEMTLGYTMVLLGEKELAVKHLTGAVAYLREPALSECQTILKFVDSDMESAKKAVLDLEHEMKSSIGLE